MIEETDNVKKVVEDKGEVKRAEVSSFVDMANSVLDKTPELKDIPTEENIKKSQEAWDKQYGGTGYEEKKASMAVESIAGHKVKREIPFEDFSKYPHLIRGIEAYGYELEESRMFEMEEGFFAVTDLAGNDMNKPKALASSGYVVETVGVGSAVDKETLEVLVDSGFGIVVEKLDTLIESLEELSVKMDNLGFTETEQATFKDFVENITKKGKSTKPQESLANGSVTVNNGEVGAIVHNTVKRTGNDFTSLVIDDEIIVEDEESADEVETKEQSILEFTEQKVIEDYKNGMSTHDILEKYDFSAGRLYSILNKHKVPYRTTGGSTGLAGVQVAEYLSDDNKRNQLIRAYTDKKMTLKDIYLAFNITKNGLFYILDTYNVPRRMPSRTLNTIK